MKKDCTKEQKKILFRLATPRKWLYYAPCSLHEGPLFLLKGHRLPSKAGPVDLDSPVQRNTRIWEYYGHELKDADHIEHQVNNALKRMGR